MAAHRIVVFLLLLLLQLAFFHAVAYDPLNGNKAACNPNCPAPGGPVQSSNFMFYDQLEWRSI
uniref:Wall-associated receptor kinase galacturonan-binding domain-containing protein n=1 Tax=Oryza punctata TaxID=4537 RepID=A0A0E0MLM9_ORYPU